MYDGAIMQCITPRPAPGSEKKLMGTKTKTLLAAATRARGPRRTARAGGRAGAESGFGRLVSRCMFGMYEWKGRWTGARTGGCGCEWVCIDTGPDKTIPVVEPFL